MMLLKIKKDRVKRMAVFFFLALLFLIILFRYLSLVPKILDSRYYENSLKNQIKNFVNRSAIMSKLNKEEFEKELNLLNKRFPKKEEIPIVLDELEQLEKKAEFKVTSISQQKLEQPVVVDVKVGGKPYKFNYQPLLLNINLACSYIKLAQFLEDLDNWHRGVVVVKGFSIQRDEANLEKLKVDDLIIKISTIGDGNE